MDRRRVLIIDDESDIRTIATAALERVGRWVVFAASSGAEGVEIAARERPDAIILDGAMPGMDGLATMAALRARAETSGVPIVILTASVQVAQQRAFLDAGAVAVLAKPFDPMTLSRDVSTALGWS